MATYLHGEEGGIYVGVPAEEHGHSICLPLGSQRVTKKEKRSRRIPTSTRTNRRRCGWVDLERHSRYHCS